MTDLEQRAARALHNCTFLPGTAAKRLARQWAAWADKTPDRPMTPGGRWTLFKYCLRYRRQISDKEVWEEAYRVMGLDPERPQSKPDTDELYRQELEKRGLKTLGESKSHV